MGGCASTEKSPMAAEPVDTSWEGTFRNYAAWLDYHARTCRQGLHPPSGTTAAGTFQSDTAQYSLHLQPSVRRGWNVDGQVREEKEVRVISQGRLAANGQAYWVEETPEQGRILTLSTFDWNTVTWKITSRHYDTTASAKKDENSSRHSKKNGVVKKVALDETLVHTTLDSHDSSTASPEKLHKQPEIVVALLKPPAKMTPIASSLQDSWGIALDDCHTQATARVVAARGLSNEDSWQFATVVALREHTVGGNSALALDMPLALVNHHRVRSSFEATQRFWEPPLGKVPAQLHGNLAPPPSPPLVVVGFANYSCYQVERHRRLVSATIYKPEATTKTGITLRQLEDKVYIVDFGNQSPWKETQLQLAMRVWAVNEQPAIDCHQVSTIIQQTKGWVVLVAERPEDVESSATAERDQATTFFVSPSAPPLLSPMPVLAEPVRDIPSNITYKDQGRDWHEVVGTPAVVPAVAVGQTFAMDV